jgi:hypothetical protein
MDGFMSRTNFRFALGVTLIGWAAAVLPASAQHFQQVPGTMNYVFAGANEVWGLLCTEVFCLHSDVFRFDSTTKKFAKVKAPPGLVTIAVGGGSAMQPDEVWALDSFNNVYRYNPSAKSFDEIPGILLSQIAAGYGDEDNCHPYEVWGVFGPNVNNPGTFRYNYCTSQFDQISTPDPFAQVAVGPDNVWAIDENSCVWQWGVSVWIEFFPATFPGPPCVEQQIAAGMTSAFAIDQYGYLDRWDNLADGAVAPSSYSHGDFYGAPVQVAAGGDGAWGIAEFTGPVYSIYRVDPLNPYIYVSAPFTPASVAVGSGTGVWAIDTSRNVYAWVRP